jgi:hypothetical protein
VEELGGLGMAREVTPTPQDRDRERTEGRRHEIEPEIGEVDERDCRTSTPGWVEARAGVGGASPDEDAEQRPQHERDPAGEPLA